MQQRVQPGQSGAADLYPRYDRTWRNSPYNESNEVPAARAAVQGAQAPRSKKMATVASLFPSQAEASRAIDELAGTEFAGVAADVYEGDVADDLGEVPPMGIPAGGSNLGGASPRTILNSRLTGLKDEELSSYLIESVELGRGVLVVADVEDHQAGALAAFFRSHGGRTSTER
jgi:hypothetical protein